MYMYALVGGEKLIDMNFMGATLANTKQSYHMTLRSMLLFLQYRPGLKQGPQLPVLLT